MAKEKGPLGLSKEVQSFLDGLTSEDKEKILSVLLKEKDDKVKADNAGNFKEELVGDYDAVIQDLKDNCVKSEDYEVNYRKLGKQIHLNLPAIGDFGGLKFDSFVSSGKVSGPDFKRAGLCNSSYSMKEILDLFDGLKKYLAIYGINDKNIDVKKIVKDIFALDREYWLSDLSSSGRYVLKGTYSSLSFSEFWSSDDFVSAGLFLKMNERDSVLDRVLSREL